MERRIPIRRNRPTQGRRKMGSVAPSPRWRGSAIDGPIKEKTVELALHLGGGATRSPVITMERRIPIRRPRLIARKK
ncbi:MAG: hypothetical protein HDR87_04980 [Bacteroides sp.]|nr:hypothetical protein [Bacteroides sp.]MBD5360046.1 hypothetical protein [Bacteroides sp.]